MISEYSNSILFVLLKKWKCSAINVKQILSAISSQRNITKYKKLMRNSTSSIAKIANAKVCTLNFKLHFA